MVVSPLLYTMTDFLSSAFGYINNFSGSSKGAVINGIVEIGTVKLRVTNVIAEGTVSSFTHHVLMLNFSFLCAIMILHIQFIRNLFTFSGGFSTIFAAQAIDSGTIYALKVRSLGLNVLFLFFFMCFDVPFLLLQRILAADKEAIQTASKEIQLLVCFHFSPFTRLFNAILIIEYFQKKVSGHPNVINFLSATLIEKSQSSHGQNEYLILTELCRGEFSKTNVNTKDTS